MNELKKEINDFPLIFITFIYLCNNCMVDRLTFGLAISRRCAVIDLKV